jgi:hypothetical protein
LAGNLLDILKRRGVLSPHMLKSIQLFVQKWDCTVHHAVVETHLVDESRLADILGEELQIPRYTRLRSFSIDQTPMKHLPYLLAMKHFVLPLEIAPDVNVIKVAIADPTDENALSEVRKALEPWKVEIGVAERSEIESAIQRLYPLDLQLPHLTRSCPKGPV